MVRANNVRFYSVLAFRPETTISPQPNISTAAFTLQYFRTRNANARTFPIFRLPWQGLMRPRHHWTGWGARYLPQKLARTSRKVLSHN